MPASEFPVSLISTILTIYFTVIFLVFAYTFTVYVLNALGLYTIAIRRGVKNPWLSFLPYGDVWTLGAIADNFRAAKGQKKSRRKVMLGLMIAIGVLYIGWIGCYFGFLFDVMEASMTAPSLLEDPTFFIGPLLGILGILLVLLVLAIILTVFQYICFYDLFTAASPNNAAAFLVLGILFSFLLPFFVFAVRKKDGGMPQPEPEAPAAELTQSAAELPAPEAPQTEE